MRQKTKSPRKNRKRLYKAPNHRRNKFFQRKTLNEIEYPRYTQKVSQVEYIWITKQKLVLSVMNEQERPV